METGNEKRDILERISSTLKAGKDEIVFNLSELKSNSTKKSIVNWLESIGVVTTTGLILSPPVNDDDHGSISDDVEWRVPIKINKDKFWEVFEGKKIRQSFEEEIPVGKLYSVSKSYPAIKYKGNNKLFRKWHLAKGLTQQYAVLRQVAEKYKRDTTKTQIKLSYQEIAEYTKDPKNCSTPVDRLEQADQKRALDGIKKNISQKFGFMPSEIYTEKKQNMAYLIVVLK